MKHLLTSLFLICIFCISSYAQKQVVEVQDYWETTKEGTLNDAVTAALNAGTLSNTVFKLKPYGTYVLTGSIITPPGQVLEITADDPGSTQATAPPMICWTASTAPSKTYLFDIAGQVKMKNVTIMWASLDGSRYTSTIRIGDSATVSGGRAEFENVMFDLIQQSSSGAIQPFATHLRDLSKTVILEMGQTLISDITAGQFLFHLQLKDYIQIASYSRIVPSRIWAMCICRKEACMGIMSSLTTVHFITSLCIHWSQDGGAICM